MCSACVVCIYTCSVVLFYQFSSGILIKHYTKTLRIFTLRKNLDTTRPLHPTTFCTTPHYTPTTLITKKIARDSLYIYTHTHESGGGGFLRFTSSPLFFPTQQHATQRNTQEGNWKAKSETRKRGKPVLFVVKMKIRGVQMIKWKIVKVSSFCEALFTLHIHKMQVNLWFYN